MPLDAAALDRAIQSSGATLERDAPDEAKEKNKRIGKLPYLALIAGEVADLITTERALGSGRGYEANPLGRNKKARLGVKLAGVMGLMGIMRHLDNKDSDKAAKLIGWIDGAAKGAIAAHNSRVK